MQHGVKHTLKLELDPILEDATSEFELGLRRAACFLQFSSLMNEAALPEKIELDNGPISYNFFPGAMSESEKGAARSEYIAWVTGNCLREIDAYFCRYLDRIWQVVEFIKLHGETVSSDFVVGVDKSFSNDTNCASKLRTLARKLEASFEDSSIGSLSSARNCLGHAAGIVRERDLNTKDHLVVSWSALEIYTEHGGSERVWSGRPIDTSELASEAGIQVCLRTSSVQKQFAVGEIINFAKDELTDILVFYHFQGAKVRDSVIQYCRKVGILQI